MCFCVADRLTHRLSFVTAKIVHHHHITRAQGRDEHVFDIGPEGIAVDRTIEDKRRVDPVVAQGCDECHGAPVSVWSATDQALTLWSPPAQRSHVGFRPCLINEDEPTWVNSALIPLPARAASAHVRAVLLLRELGLFLNEYPVRCTKAQTVR